MFSVTGVVALDLLAQGGAVYMGVNLCAGDVFVTEHELNGLKIGSALEQCCGEAMPQCMWTNGLLDTRYMGSFLDNHKDHIAGYGFAATT